MAKLRQNCMQKDLHLKVEDADKTQVYGPGEVFWESGQPMTVENVGGTDAEFVIFEIAPLPAK